MRTARSAHSGLPRNPPPRRALAIGRAVRPIGLLLAACLVGGCSSPHVTPASMREQVVATEHAFAKSMADRNFEAFSSFVSEEAVFFSGPAPLRGKAQVTSWWARYFDTPEAPFSWEPDQVEVLESATLALSTGPVRDPAGKVFARFTSIWRLEAPGKWRIVFDKGSPVVPASSQ